MKIIRTFSSKEGPFRIELEKDYRGKIKVPLYINKLKNGTEIILYVNEYDFDQDMKTLVPEAFGEDFVMACFRQLEKLIEGHFTRYGRILPADLELYCAESLAVIVAISETSPPYLSIDSEDPHLHVIYNSYNN